MTYEAVIFDLWGTLAPNLRDHERDAVAREMGVAVGADPEAFAQGWMAPSIASQRTTGGHESVSDTVGAICRELAVEPLPDAVERAAGIRLRYTRRCMAPRRDAEQTLKQLCEGGLKLGLMTVCSPDAVEAWQESRLAPLFDAALFSCKVGLSKPDPGFYALAFEQLGLEPGQCLYVGDGAGNELTGAKRAGAHPVLICAPGEGAAVMARDEARNWTGPTIHQLSEVLTIVQKESRA